MAILGLNHFAIRSRFEEVVEFAELGDAIDAPLQTYSSGMAARLLRRCLPARALTSRFNVLR